MMGQSRKADGEDILLGLTEKYTESNCKLNPKIVKRGLACIENSLHQHSTSALHRTLYEQLPQLIRGLCS